MQELVRDLCKQALEIGLPLGRLVGGYHVKTLSAVDMSADADTGP